MQALFVHISDIHFKDTADPIFSKPEQLVSSLTESLFNKQFCFFIVTGDIASTGSVHQYETASIFFETIKKCFIDKFPNTHLFLFFVPGNHDCDFENKSTNMRNTLLPNCLKNLDLLNDDVTLKALLSHQSNYDHFSNKFVDHSICTINNGLLKQFKISIDKFTLFINCYNSSWCSQKHEKQGSIDFPKTFIADKETDSSLTISAFHHPYSWLNPDTKNELIRAFEDNSDIILSGHEHEFIDNEIHNHTTNNITNYYQGSLFSQPSNDFSEFNVFEYNFESNMISPISIKWHDGIYKSAPTAEPYFINSAIINHKTLSLSESFNNYLKDTGAIFCHKRKDNLSLDDIFMYPNFKISRSNDLANNRFKINIIKGGYIFDFACQKHKIAILGSSKSGKSTLIKKLFLQMFYAKKYPIVIEGIQLKSTKDKSIINIIKSSVEHQYGPGQTDLYLQLATNSRVLIIDDYHLSKLNSDARYNALKKLEDIFSIIIILTRQITEALPVNVKNFQNFSLKDYIICEICEMGNLQKHEMIENWLKLGQSETLSDVDLNNQAHFMMNDLNSITGNGIVPSHPFYIITIIQTIEIKHNIDRQYGSFGYFYQLLINEALLKSKYEISPDFKNSFLEEIAIYMYTNKTFQLAETDLKAIYTIFSNKYDIDTEYALLKNDLYQNDFLVTIDDFITIRYPYIFYYFVASWMNTNNDHPAYREQIDNMLISFMDHISDEDHNNMLMFYFYLTKDHNALEIIKDYMDQLFYDIPICDFDADVSFLNRHEPRITKVVLNGNCAKERTKNHYRQLDDSPDRNGKLLKPFDDENRCLPRGQQYDSNLASSTIHLVGQVLRNFPGSLYSEMKTSLIDKCYKLMLRSLNYILLSFKHQYKQIQDIVGTLIGLPDKEITQNEFDIIYDTATHFFLTMLCVNHIKCLCREIGSEYFYPTYKKIKEAHNDIPYMLIDLGIKLKYSPQVPIKDLQELHKMVHKNPMTDNVLKWLLVDKIYFFDVPVSIRQKICDLLKMKIEDPVVIEETVKKSLE